MTAIIFFKKVEICKKGLNWKIIFKKTWFLTSHDFKDKMAELCLCLLMFSEIT